MCVCVCTICSIYGSFTFVGLLAFVQHVTGMTTVRQNSITVDLQHDSEVIVAHVCANSLLLPRGLFTDKGSYQQFSNAMEVVLSTKTYDTVYLLH